MFGNMRKEIGLSGAASLVVGVFGFLFLQMTSLQSLLLIFLFMAYLLLVLYIYREYMHSKRPQKKEKTVPEEKYKLLKNKLDAATAKADTLEKESKTTEMFLASMSHEIRTPLNGIVGLTELLDGTELTQEQKEFVSMIRESSYNLNVIVNDILDVSKINAGKMELESIPFNLFGKVEASLGVFVPKIEEKGITLNLFTDPKIPKMLMGDPTRLSQVISNLVSNALKFTDKGGKIDVRAEYLKKKNDTVSLKISVSDTGIGLSKAQQAKIFKAYGQADASTTRKSGGTGLGLTISSKIIEAMGGKLRVKSKEGEGSTFYFTLTLPKAAQQEETADIAKDLYVGAVLSENDPKSRCGNILRTYIEYYGAQYQAYTCEEIFTALLPDVLLVDHHCVDGETLERFAKLNCRKVLLTTSARQGTLGNERNVFDEVIYMPVSFEKIGTILQHKAEKIHRIPQPAAKKKRFDNLHILVAEDNPINQKLIKIVLENFGLKVTLASDGEEAVALRKKEAYDMVFMDIQMPKMGGVEATHEILAYEEAQGVPHVPIIALTANALSGDKEKYMAEGMDDYATKPLDLERIEKLVSEYCDVTKG